MKNKSFRVGDIVRRKGDTSGRTRVVVFASMGGNVVELDTILDRWLIWDASKLELVQRQPATAPHPAAAAAHTA